MPLNSLNSFCKLVSTLTVQCKHCSAACLLEFDKPIKEHTCSVSWLLGTRKVIILPCLHKPELQKLLCWMTLPPTDFLIFSRLMLCKSNRETGLVFKYFALATARLIQSKAVGIKETLISGKLKDETSTFVPSSKWKVTSINLWQNKQ